MDLHLALPLLVSSWILTTVLILRLWHDRRRIRRSSAGEEPRRSDAPVDLSALKAAELNLLRYEQIVEHSSEMLMFVDREQRFQVVNPAYAAWRLSTPEALRGRSVREVVGEDRYARLEPEIVATLAGERRQFRFEGHYPDGRKRYLDVVQVPFWHHGEVIGLIVSKHDFTAVQEALDALETERAGLETRVVERTAELQEARRQAEAAARGQARFLAHMSHEIRTPMNGIIGLSELALQRARDPMARDYLDKLHQSAVNLMGILNDILDQSKIESGRMELESSVFDSEALLADLHALFDHVAQSKGLGFSLTAAPETPRWLVGDVLRLRQILSNLLSNALKFTERGRISLQVECLERNEETTRLAWTVEDTGPGMDAATQARLFDPFTQGDESTARRFGGTGLGLSISHHLVDLMGGRLQVESTPGVGSRFRFELRLAIADAPPDIVYRPDDRFEQLDLSRIRLLVAEDQPINQRVIGDMLRLLGLNFDLAGNGHEALACLETTRYDLVLMDIQMPELDGLSATRRIREHPDWSGLPIIALTAGVTPAERQRLSAVGMNDLLPKPVTLEALRTTLSRWLGDLARVSHSRPSAGTPDESPSALRLPGFDLRALQRIIGATQVLEHLHQFAATVRDDPDAIADALTAGEDQSAAGIVHRLKGVAGTIGATDIQAAALAFESVLRDGRDPTAALAALRQAHAAALARIDALPSPDASMSADPTPADPARVRALAEEIHTRLSEGLFVPAELLASFEAVLPGTERERLLELKQHLQHFDYSRADQLLEPFLPTDIPS